MSQSSSYVVHLVARLEHVRGAEPDWDAVARAAAERLEGENLTISVDLPGGRFESGRVLVDQVTVDEAEDPE